LVDAHSSTLAVVHHTGVGDVKLQAVFSEFVNGYVTVDLDVGMVGQHMVALHTDVSTKH
jgi:hypothetical protein